jgi:diphosphomevalonate decarboxylase
MIRTEGTSPYHGAFVHQADRDLSAAREAIADRDLTALGRVAERSCLRMHAAMMAGDPPLIYLTSESWQVIEAMLRLRAEGVPLFFTADAGPNVKVFCEPAVTATVEDALCRLTCVKQVIQARPGAGARLVEP